MEKDILFKTNGIKYQNILRYPDIEILNSEVTFLAGASGSGKSTLLRLFNKTLSADTGNILYKGESIKELDSLKLRREVLLVSQEIYLFDDTIKANFEAFYNYRNLPIPDETSMKRILMLCLADFPLDKKCQLLSGGERQRVYLAIYLSFKPDVILLDEPTSALDDQTSNKLFENLITFTHENRIALIVVTHQQFLATKYADRIINLENAKIESLESEAIL